MLFKHITCFNFCLTFHLHQQAPVIMSAGTTKEKAEKAKPVEVIIREITLSIGMLLFMTVLILCVVVLLGGYSSGGEKSSGSGSGEQSTSAKGKAKTLCP